MFCLPLSLRNSRYYTATKNILVSCSNSFGRSLVALLPRVVVAVSQNQRGCALSLYTYVKRIFDLQCETASRIRRRRKVRPKQTYSLRNRHPQYPYLSRVYPRNLYPSSLLRTHRRRTSFQSRANGATRRLTSSGYTTPGILCSHWEKL